MASASAGDANGPVIAIHIGSTHARVGLLRKGRVEVIADNSGQRLIPAFIAFTNNGVLFGEHAKEQQSSNPNNTISGFMRMISLSNYDLVRELDKQGLRFKHHELGPVIEVKNEGKVQDYTVTQVMGLLMRKLKETAESFLGHKVTKAVIAIPASFSKQQKTSVKSAAKYAGLKVMELIKEPVAALVAHNLTEGNVLIIHCGGERTAVSVAVNGRLERSGTSGQAFGGRECTQRLYNHCLKQIQTKTQVTGQSDRKTDSCLMQKVEKAKIRLSFASVANVRHADVILTITQSKFNELCDDLFYSLDTLIDKALEQNSLTADQIQKVLLIGGSSGNPKLVQLAIQKFGQEKLVATTGLLPHETVINGTAIRSAPYYPSSQTQTSCPPAGKVRTRPEENQKADPIPPKMVKLSRNSTSAICDSDAKVGPVIGIDLGTTCSCVGIWKNGKVEIIPNEFGKKVTPSVVAFKSNPMSGTTRVVGEEAKEYASVEPQHVVSDTKRLIGRKFADSSVQQDMRIWPFTVIDEGSKPVIQVIMDEKKERFHAEEISAFILSKMKSMAESYTGQMVKKAVITVPAYFNNFQRTATKEAAKIAGLEVMKIISEPTAAAIAYGIDSVGEKKRNILVYDLGGGTFDASVLSVKDQEFEVKATAGDTHLGGVDFDNRLVSYFRTRFMDKHGWDLLCDKKAMIRLRFACEKAKIRLSQDMEAKAEIDCLFHGIDFSESMTRSQFEELCDDLFKKTIQLLKDVISDAGLEPNDIDDIVMVGGSTRIPKIRELVSTFFGGRELRFNINPDEAVAYGAVIQAGMLSELNDLALVTVRDVTPLSLGTQKIGGLMMVFMPRNSRIPAEIQVYGGTARDGQTEAHIVIYQGERQMVKDNVKLGQLIVTGIPAAKRGVNAFPVIFKLDEDGILEVKVQPKPGAPFQSIRITDSCDLTDQEIEVMRKKADEMQENDRREAERVGVRNDLYFACYDNRNDERIGDRCQHTLQWLEEHPDAGTDILTEKLKHVYD